MSQVELYQSVLQKLGQLPSGSLAQVDAYLSQLLQAKSLRKNKAAKIDIAKFSGAWKNWDEREFLAFLEQTRDTRQDLFADRGVDL
ncbi:MAG: hypothetical protein ACKVU2_04375 [Saprospiraceae bacterium]